MYDRENGTHSCVEVPGPSPSFPRTGFGTFRIQRTKEERKIC